MKRNDYSVFDEIREIYNDRKKFKDFVDDWNLDLNNPFDFVWDLATKGTSEKDIINAVKDHFGISEAKAKAYVKKEFKKLYNNKFRKED